MFGNCEEKKEEDRIATRRRGADKKKDGKYGAVSTTLRKDLRLTYGHIWLAGELNAYRRVGNDAKKQLF